MSTVVGYPGPAGSHSAVASAALAPDGATTEPYASFIAVVEAAVAAEVARRTTSSTRRRSRSSPR